jgi:RimJ/RimL family protein N-acetyltransferase
VPEQRATTGAIGLGLVANWIELEPYSAANAAEFAQFDEPRQVTAAMGTGSPSTSSEIAAPMLVRERRTGEAVGVVENHPTPGKVAVIVIYLDPQRSRAGFGVEVTFLYMSHLFDSGARLVAAEVLEFNTQVIGILTKFRITPVVRLREHVYTAGRFWDLLIWSLDREEWVAIVDRYRRILPGGGRPPAAIGGRGARVSP